MNWSDERYVRFYTRDTPAWRLLSWRARGLLGLLMRAVDRAGVMDVGELGAKAVAIIVDAREDVAGIEAALGELLDDGCVQMSHGTLVIPNFIEAQNAAQGDRQRQEESRARRRDMARRDFEGRDEPSRIVTGASQNVTKPSQPVTGCHAESHDVTLSCTVPSCAEKEHVSGGEPPDPSNQAEIPRNTDRHAAAVTAVLKHWREKAQMPNAAIDGKAGKARRARIRARMAEGWTVERLKAVADGMTRDPWLMGADPKSRPGGYRDVETVYRDAAQCERLEALATAPAPPAKRNGVCATPGEFRPAYLNKAPDPIPPLTPEEFERAKAAMLKVREQREAAASVRRAAEAPPAAEVPEEAPVPDDIPVHPGFAALRESVEALARKMSVSDADRVTLDEDEPEAKA